ncbi:MAG: hypothetical protein HY788_11430 [Deltaproteobacteria bacterium]|nr:hypothetical protein [Deltaproteobacteria bacterium]
MDHPGIAYLRTLSKEQLIDAIKMYSRNWMTLDGLWFSGVEDKYGLDAAMDLDVRMWRIGSKIEAKRIKESFGLGGGIENVLRAIDLMSWAPSFDYEYQRTDNGVVWTCRQCPPQEQRARLGKAEFPCRPTFEACFANVIQVVDPGVRVECRFCPPDPHPEDAWCEWVFWMG